tara:strand:- start:863 stop:1396 length:534 start_codon:yes stop_codon:yes gene_type:complete
MNSVLRNLILLSLAYAQQGSSYYNKADYNIIFERTMTSETIDAYLHKVIDEKKQFVGKIKNGKKEGLWTEWYPNQRKLEEYFSDGVLDGSVSLYFKNGQREWRYTYNKGILDGRWTKWNKNGKKIIDGGFECGDSVGVWRWWNDMGELEKERKYKKRKNGIKTGLNEYVVIEKIERE